MLQPTLENRPGRKHSGLWLTAGIALGMTACSTVNIETESAFLTTQGLRSAGVLREATNQTVAAFAETGTVLLEGARQLDKQGHRPEAAGCYLKAAMEARSLLLSGQEAKGSAEETALLDLHNSSLARFAELWAASGDSQFTCKGETMEVRVAPKSAYRGGYFDRVMASESITIKGVARQERLGLGAALVGVREQRPERAAEMRFYPPRGLHVPVTLTVDDVRTRTGQPSVVTVSLRNPAVDQEIALGTRKLPVAADFSAPIAVILAGRNEWAWGLEGFFKAEERLQSAGVFLTEPYDPNRIPVLLIHGLVSVPIIWRDVVAEMQADPELARRYQFMVFVYPSSFPIIESASLLRRELAEVRSTYDPNGNDPLTRNMVVGGHSMGGILTHTLIADIGDSLWKELSDQPFESLQLSPERRAEIRNLVFFKPDPAVRRAIFFSTPHRGAKMAEKNAASLISRTARLPRQLVASTASQLSADTGEDLHLKIELDKKVTSVQALQPGSPMVAALDASPIRPGVTYHSVIGDRGKGDTPESSDGVVEYWSSHLDGAASEIIVPTGHSSFTHPRALQEMRRVLRLHAGLP